ncbi:TetR/AcrR family transcriptional regulator [Cryptosporangium phraense]|uniref:TetR/AcrR family transcriptional regulator n=1 Tax=Cryptosporangium phraense TaxID=2593070 RepID=A0A545AN23_9ACTN|nr:TetR/AcrR family transcriptional regulator [Cryptosporangium phraense]TQS42145.1 TetR/AcrR family transcriptional regulator [Cryptosporangium phraense]
MTSAAPVTKPGRKRDHTRDPEILDAAIEVLAENGYDCMTIDQVAARAKAGKATLYRRWPSKAELVIDAVGCLKKDSYENLPDTGTLRGDLLAMMRPPTIEDAQKKIRIMSGVVSMLDRSPELGEALRAAMVEPRAAANRVLMRRAIDRGEIRADCDIEMLAMVSASMVFYRTMIMRQAVDREFLVSIIDEVLLPAVRKTDTEVTDR